MSSDSAGALPVGRAASFVFRLLVAVLLSNSANAQFTQQGPQLAGSGTGPLGQFGRSVTVSADGNTAMVGGYRYDVFQSAAWVFTRSAGVWTQQGDSLIGNDAVPNSGLYESGPITLSADGNTALLGGPADSYDQGAAWVFTRSGNVWTQQGSKLVIYQPSNPFVRLGYSVALSADGNTALIGGTDDKSLVGAAWVFTRSGGVWTQQAKLTAADAAGHPHIGTSVDLSADGNTAIVGGPWDDWSNTGKGAAWVFTRSGGTWTQQGSKLVGAGGTDLAYQGSSVALSADGNTALVGGPDDDWSNTGNGATWVFTRSGGVWTQQGSRLVGTGGACCSVSQGTSVTLSADGNLAFVGGPDDNRIGATWAFTRTGGVWTQQGSKLIGTGGGKYQGQSVALSADGATALVGGSVIGTGSAWVFTSPGSPVPSQLAFVQQPSTAIVGAAISPPVTVQLQNSVGNPVAQAGVSITISLSSGTGALSGTLSQPTNASGLATFTNLSIDQVGTKQLAAASAGLVSTLSTSFTVSPQPSAPVFTSPDHATFMTGSWRIFTITTTGWPVPILSLTPAIPSGLTWAPNADGTGTISGTPAAGTAGVYSLTIWAAGFGGPKTQLFALTVVDPAGLKFYSLVPCRILDTRNAPDGPLAGPALQAGATRIFSTVSAACGVPAAATSISGNATVTGATQPGYLTLFPADGARPLASSINFSAGQTRANNVVLPVSLDGTGSIGVFTGSAGPVHLILDVNGYFK